MIFSFEKMALRDAVKTMAGARAFARGLYDFLGFIAQPDRHLFLKPMVTRAAARKYDYDFVYKSRPKWETYQSLHNFAETVRRDQGDLKSRDMIDLQSFIWVQGSDEYS